MSEAGHRPDWLCYVRDVSTLALLTHSLLPRDSSPHSHKRAAATPCITYPPNFSKVGGHQHQSRWKTFSKYRHPEKLCTLPFLPLTLLLPVLLHIFLKQGFLVYLSLAILLRCSCLGLQLLRIIAKCPESWHLLPFIGLNQVTCLLYVNL